MEPVSGLERFFDAAERLVADHDRPPRHLSGLVIIYGRWPPIQP
jgi:hypothetical protein